jgi:hypothetical protein
MNIYMVLSANMNFRMLNETHVTNKKSVIDQFETWAKFKDLIFEIENLKTKSKSDENLWAEYDFPLSETALYLIKFLKITFRLTTF